MAVRLALSCVPDILSRWTQGKMSTSTFCLLEARPSLGESLLSLGSTSIPPFLTCSWSLPWFPTCPAHCIAASAASMISVYESSEALISESVRQGVTCSSRRSSVILVMHCAFLSGSHGPCLYSLILARHSFASLDSWSLVWEGSVPLVDDGAPPCSVMSPAGKVVEQAMGRMTVITVEDLTEKRLCQQKRKRKKGRAEGPILPNRVSCLREGDIPSSCGQLGI